MSLSCECGTDGYASFYQTTYRRARKTHRCRECGIEIAPGDLYERTISVFQGDFTAEKKCEPCSDLAESITALGFCYTPGDLAIAYAEYLKEYVRGAVRHDEETDLDIYPANHLIDEHGNPKRWRNRQAPNPTGTP